MDKQTNQFATVKQGNVIQKVGRSMLTHPETYYDGSSKATNGLMIVPSLRRNQRNWDK